MAILTVVETGNH